MLNGFCPVADSRFWKILEYSKERPFLTASFCWQAIFENVP